MQSKIELQRQKINAVRKLLRSAGPLCGTVALIAGQVIAPRHRWWIVAVGVRKSLAGMPLYRWNSHCESGVRDSASDWQF